MDHKESPSGSCSKYKGVRKRKWGKWVSEIRLPNSRERIWLGSYDSPAKAARAFDAALYCLRGRGANFNFPENPPEIAGGRELNPHEIQAVAARLANDIQVNNNNNNNIVMSNLDEISHSPTTNKAVEIEKCYTSSSSSGSDRATVMQQPESEMMNWSTFLSMLDTNQGLSNYDPFPELDLQLYPPPAIVDDDNVVDDENGCLCSSSQSSFLWNF